jgi:hypothetical protein
MGGDEMTLLSFVVEMIKAAAWPITVLVSAVMLRGHFGRLASGVARFEGWGVKLDFRDSVERLAVATSETGEAPGDEADIPAPSATEPVEPEDQDQAPSERPTAWRTWNDFHPKATMSRRLRQQLADSDEQAFGKVMMAWKRVSDALITGARAAGLPEGKLRSFTTRQLALYLQSSRRLTADTLRLVYYAQDARNKAAHEGAPGMGDAIAYEALADELVKKIHAEAQGGPGSQ